MYHLFFRLFPTREHSNYNKFSIPLQQHEIMVLQMPVITLFITVKEINKDVGARSRIIQSYAMLLDFYGLKLIDEVTGAIWQFMYVMYLLLLLQGMLNVLKIINRDLII